MTKTTSNPRQQHYNPASWLALFTIEGKRDGRLWVFDPDNRKQWGSQPSKSAREADYLTIRGDGIDPYHIERLLGRVETAGLPLLNQVVSDGEITVTNAMNPFFVFLGVQVLRGPALREMIVGTEERLAEMALRLMGSSPEFFERARAAYVAANPGKDLTWDGLQGVLNDPGFAVKIGNPAHQHALGLSSAVLDTAFVLRQRTWVVRRVADGVGDLVTSDHPVTVVWLHPDRYPEWRDPGLGLEDTEVFVALSRRVALVGRFDDTAQDGPLRASDVATMNSRTVRLSHRYIFGPRPTISVMSGDGTSVRIECHPTAPSFSDPIPWELDGWVLATEPT